MTRRLLVATVIAATALILAAAPAVPASADPPVPARGAPPGSPPPDGRAHTVTLLTGDRVTANPDGSRVFHAGEGREHVGYTTMRTWRTVPVARSGDTGVAFLRHPKGAAAVSFRASTVDTAGNTSTQTTIRSYSLN